MKKRKIIKKIKKETNKSRISIILDYLVCSLKYKASFKDYYKLEMYKMNKFLRSTILTKGKNNAYIKKYNNSNYERYLNNIDDFYNYFSKSLNRKYIIALNKEELDKTLETHKDYVVKKDLNKEVYVVEEDITSNDMLSKYFKTDNFKLIVFTFLGSIVKVLIDIEGYKAVVDLETGEVSNESINEEGELKEIPKVVIPKFKEALEFVESISLDIPSISYIEWHLKISNDLVYLENARSNPDYINYQLPLFRKNDIGILPDLEVIERRKIN